MYIILLDLRIWCSGVDGIDETQIPAFSTGVVAVLVSNEVYGQSRNVVVCSGCLPYDSVCSLPSSERVEIIKYSGKGLLDLILGRDANSHHIVCGSSDMNARSRAMTERLSIADLDLLNLQEGHGFFIKRRQETVDLILSSRGMVSEAFG
jgi:hypothetical protein